MYQLSLILPEKEFDPTIIEELAMSAYKQIGHEGSFRSDYVKVQVENHIGVIENLEFYKIKQAFVKRPETKEKIGTVVVSTPISPIDPLASPTSLWDNLMPTVNLVSSDIDSTNYKVMYLDENLIIKGDICDDLDACSPLFKLGKKEINGVEKSIIYTNIKSGIVLLSILINEVEIEDSESLKQAIIRYVLARITLAKAYKEMDSKQIAFAMELEKDARTFMGKLKGELNLPDENTLEKLKAYNGGLNSNKYQEGFIFNPRKLKRFV
jgi:hypothetical protein